MNSASLMDEAYDALECYIAQSSRPQGIGWYLDRVQAEYGLSDAQRCELLKHYIRKV